jgi:hypothetical protein
MNAGDAFFIKDRSVDTHLWVIISDTEKDPDRVVMVSITTYESYKEDVCLLNVGDHPRITHESCVFYKETRMTTLERLLACRDQGSFSIQPPVADEVLTRIRDGVSKSRTIKPKFIDILLEQRVIE